MSFHFIFVLYKVLRFFYFHFLPPFSLDPEHPVGSTIDQLGKISPPYFVIYSADGPTPNETTYLKVAKLGTDDTSTL